METNMEINGLKKLISGSDVRGVAVKTEEKEITLTDEAVYAIVRTFIKWLSEKKHKKTFKIAIGHDVRISTERILSAAVKAICDSGCTAVDTGLCSTPSMFMLLKDKNWDCDASIMITASHLPYDRNGLKFFTPNGGLEGDEIAEILGRAEKGDCLPLGKGECQKKSYLNEYCAGLVEHVRTSCGTNKPLKGKKIIVDAGNGAGGFFVDKVLVPLGADTEGSQFLEPDGLFPNHIPNPEDKQAIESLKKAVLKNKADLGIIFDTDVDRAGAVNSNGEEINRNKLIALMSAILLKDKPGTIVTDSVTSDGLTEFIQSLGGKHVRFKRGYKHVIDEAIRRNKEGEYAPLAMETSGHAAFKENYFLDDGAYLVTKILIENLSSPVEEDEVRISFSELSQDYKSEGENLIEDLKQIAANTPDWILAPDNYEGVKVSFKGEINGWFLVRQSVHDPVLPINFECNEHGGNVKIAQILIKVLNNYSFLNTQKLKEFIQKG
jgi:phosphomannomutase